jgi:ATP-dependent protease HslVU (ClpYQ) peptidase subunit
MTCIIGAVDKETGDVYIGGDSAGVSGHDITTVSGPKVFVKGQYAFGYAGSFRFGQILKSVFEPPIYRGEVSPEDWLTGELAEHLRATVKVFGFGKSKDGREEGGLALVGFQGRLFMLQDEFEFVEARDGIMGIGIGDYYALAAMKAFQQANQDHLAYTEQSGLYTTEEMVLKSLAISEFYSGGVRSPFTVVKLGLLDGKPGKQRKGNPRGNKSRKKRKKA